MICYVVVVPFLKVDGIALFPFILVRNRQLFIDKTLIRHEQIHLKQQLEMLVLPFYLCYLMNYLFNLAKYKSHLMAYERIIFEKEAYRHEHDERYLEKRKFFACFKRNGI